MNDRSNAKFEYKGWTVNCLLVGRRDRRFDATAVVRRPVGGRDFIVQRLGELPSFVMRDDAIEIARLQAYRWIDEFGG